MMKHIQFGQKKSGLNSFNTKTIVFFGKKQICDHSPDGKIRSKFIQMLHYENRYKPSERIIINFEMGGFTI